MRNISSAADLKDAISELEFNRAVHRRMLKDSFNSTVENLNPGNVFKNITGAIANPGLLTNIIPAAVGLGVGFVSDRLNRRFLAGGSKSRLKRILITLAFYGVTRALVKSPVINRYFGKRLAHSLFG